MVVNIKDIIKIVKNMAKERIFGLMEVHMMDVGGKIN
jgi:hypothetical protein